MPTTPQEGTSPHALKAKPKRSRNRKEQKLVRALMAAEGIKYTQALRRVREEYRAWRLAQGLPVQPMPGQQTAAHDATPVRRRALVGPPASGQRRAATQGAPVTPARRPQTDRARRREIDLTRVLMAERGLSYQQALNLIRRTVAEVRAERTASAQQEARA